MKEFDLIRAHFTHAYDAELCKQRGVVLGVGDDCAITEIPRSDQLVFSMDTLVEGTHFLPSMDPADLAWRLVGSTVSDLAAMGAEPLWITLALTMPQADSTWLASFSSAFKEACDHYSMLLIGGDTTKGPLCLTAQVHGKVPLGKALTRSSAQVGDDLYVTGTLGDSRLGLELQLKPNGHGFTLTHAQRDFALQRFNRPTARIEAGLSLREIASSCMDISDGLAGDAKHLSDRSGVKLVIDADVLPCSEAVRALPDHLAKEWMLTGGEDFELLFSASPDHRDAIQKLAATLNLPITKIGHIESGAGAYIAGDYISSATGYQHFHTCD